MKFAIIRSGGKQYWVSESQSLRIEKIAGKAKDKINLDQVLLAGEEDGPVKIGQPLISGAKVIASIVKQDRADKISVIKFKRKVRYRRKIGHRQLFTEINIEKIQA